MSGVHLFSTMAMLGGDILSLFSIMGSAVVLLDSFVYNSPLHRLGKFFDMSVVCLTMGTMGQFAIAYTGAQVERAGLFQIPVNIVNSLFALSFLCLLVSWFIRRIRPQRMRFWRNFYLSIWRGAKPVAELVSRINYLDKDLVSMANQFDVYDKLGWYYRWQFRRHISWLGKDQVSLRYLLDFEKELKNKSLSFFKITEIIEELLTWYHREEHDDRLPNRVPRERLPDMLQVMLAFYSKSRRLHRSWRELIIRILQAEEEVRAAQGTGSGIPPEQFRGEATKAISNLSTNWGKRDEAYLKGGANDLLRYLTNIARHVSNLQMFTQFQTEAANVIAKIGLSRSGEKLRCLEIIADKVNDLQVFTVIFQDIVPVYGLERTSSLMGICKDFQEFEFYYHRINEQLKWWQFDHIALFGRAKDTSELDGLLVFLETLAKHERMTKYIQYTQVHGSGTLPTHISNALHTYKGQVLQACLNDDWKREPEYDPFMDDLIDKFEQSIVLAYLSAIWYSSLQARKIRWEFTRFTEYIPYGIRGWDWTKDDDKTRSYWNSGEAISLERDRYINVLEPILLSIFRIMDLSEIEALSYLLPQHFGIEAFIKTVKVPMEWEKGTVYDEAYDKWAGFYTQEVEVARPKGFIDHTFTFERPALQNAITFLKNIDKVHEAIQAYNKS